MRRIVRYLISEQGNCLLQGKEIEKTVERKKRNKSKKDTKK